MKNHEIDIEWLYLIDPTAFLIHFKFKFYFFIEPATFLNLTFSKDLELRFLLVIGFYSGIGTI